MQATKYKSIHTSRHSGMDDRQGWWKCGKQVGTCAACRNPDHMDVNDSSHPWLLDSGNPCRNDEFLFGLMAWVTLRLLFKPVLHLLI
jgi:hypothetical protein